MKINRVGIVPNVEAQEVPDLHRSALILSVAETDLPRYGFARMGHLQQGAEMMRLPDVGGCVIWGSDKAKIAALVLRHPFALMLICITGKVPKTGKLAEAAERAARNGCDVHFVTATKKGKAKAYDLGPDRFFAEAADLTRPPQTQNAPHIPRKEAEPAEPYTLPSVPRAEAAPAVPYTLPSVPRSGSTPEPKPAPAMPPREVPQEPAQAPEAPKPEPEVAQSPAEPSEASVEPAEGEG